MIGVWADLRAIGQLTGDPQVFAAAVGPGEVLVVAIVFGTIGTIAYPFIRALTRDPAEKGNAVLAPRDIAERLDRMERGIEAIAEEVERISENQRFVTQLMSNDESRHRLPPIERR
jgi:hypothetical protein